MENEIRMTKLASCAGCGAKVGAGTLAKLLKGLPSVYDERLLVGYDTSDDACVYKISDELVLVETLDFFPPIVDDPFMFGQIAAANAISDIYAMGAQPKLALNIMAVSPQMPDEAVREVLLNCLVHRDYSFSGSTLVNIYDDRIEFISLGGLVTGLKMETIFIGVSQTRNPALAAVFYRLRLIESFGTGIEKIQQSYLDTAARPEFIAVYGGFKVVLPNVNEVQAKELGISETQECYGFANEKEKVMQLAAMQGYVTRKQVEDALQVKTTKAYMLLQELCDVGRLAPIGVGRSRKYISR